MLIGLQMDTIFFSPHGDTTSTYKDLWDASIGEELSCQREVENYTDANAVSIMKDNNHEKTCYNISVQLFQKLS